MRHFRFKLSFVMNEPAIEAAAPIFIQIMPTASASHATQASLREEISWHDVGRRKKSGKYSR